jgi:hypothetical protein
VPQDRFQRPILVWRWLQLVLAGFAHALLVQTDLFCLIAGKPAIHRDQIGALAGHRAVIPMSIATRPQPDRSLGQRVADELGLGARADGGHDERLGGREAAHEAQNLLGGDGVDSLFDLLDGDEASLEPP